MAVPLLLKFLDDGDYKLTYVQTTVEGHSIERVVATTA